MVVGFGDGVVRVLTIASVHEHSLGHKGKDECEIVLRQAFKPHTGPVTSLAIDNKGEVLATGVSCYLPSPGRGYTVDSYLLIHLSFCEKSQFCFEV